MSTVSLIRSRLDLEEQNDNIMRSTPRTTEIVALSILPILTLAHSFPLRGRRTYLQHNLPPHRKLATRSQDSTPTPSP